jgi:hypothetical protein
MNGEFWELRFSVEVSALYHNRRRGTLWTIVRSIRMITFASAVISLVTAFNPLNFNSWTAAIIVAVVSILIGVVSLLDLVENYSGRAQRHEELYKRFKELQARIEQYSGKPEEYLPALRAQAQAIRVDEPPVLWAIYSRCWNQAIEHHQAERRGYYRKISWWRGLLGGFVQFDPRDFPAVAA